MTDQTGNGKSRDGFALCHGTARGNTLQSSPLGCSLGDGGGGGGEGGVQQSFLMT